MRNGDRAIVNGRRMTLSTRGNGAPRFVPAPRARGDPRAYEANEVAWDEAPVLFDGDRLNVVNGDDVRTFRLARAPDGGAVLVGG